MVWHPDTQARLHPNYVSGDNDPDIHVQQCKVKFGHLHI